MKTLIKTVALAVIALSCSKPESFVTVRFGVGVPCGAVTRAMPDGLSDALSATAPSGPFTLSLQSLENSLRTYSATTGVPLSVAVGSYSVTGSGSGRSVAQASNGAVYSSPSWSLSSEVTVRGDGEFSLPASWTCFALVFDLSETDGVSVDGERISSLPGTDGWAVLYARPDAGKNWYVRAPLSVTVHPKDAVLGEAVSYDIITTTPQEGFVAVQNGYWYKLSPGRVEVVSGSMGVSFPEWMEGSY